MTESVIPNPPFWEKFLKFFKKVEYAGGKSPAEQGKTGGKLQKKAESETEQGGGVKIPIIDKTAKIAT